MTTHSKPLWWSCFILTALIIYLIPEAIFNAELVNVAGNQATSQQQLKTIELFGRAISGIGASILLSDLLIKRSVLANKSKTLLTALLISVITWPAVFFGQKWVIEQWVVAPSSSEQRQHAVLSQTLKDALTERSITIENLEYNPNSKPTNVEKTFLSLFGSIVYANDSFIDRIDDNKETIIRNLIENKAHHNFETYYQQFKKMRESVKEQYKTYRKHSQSFNKKVQKQIQNPEQTAEPYWDDIRSQLKEGWQQYRDSQSQFKQKMENKAETMAPKMHDFFSRRERCSRYNSRSSQKDCYEQYEQRYRQQIQNNGIPYIESDYWLVKKKISNTEKVGTSIANGIATMGISWIKQGAEYFQNGDDGMRDYRYYHTDDSAHYYKKLLNHMEPTFKKRSGYPLHLNFSQFSNHNTTSQKIRNALKDKGVIVDSNWSVQNKDAFERAVIDKIVRQAREQWRTNIQKRSGINLKPNLSWQQFEKSAPIQKKIMDEIPSRYRSYPIDLDWNNQQFYDNVITPIIEDETQRQLAIIKASKNQFGDNERHEKTGKDALRAIIVPAISMSLSLFLVLATLIKIPFKLLEIYWSKKAVNTPKRYHAIKITLQTVAIGIIITLPFMIQKHHLVEDNSATQYFLEQMENNDNALGAFVVEWTLIAQPLIQPAGSTLKDIFPLISGFEILSPSLESVDNKLFKDNNGNYAPLTVNTTPDNAQVRVMNIVPKYYDGMILKKGTYDIEVSHPGYNTKRQDIELGEQSTFHFNLNKGE